MRSRFKNTNSLILAIPTIRTSEVIHSVHAYAENFIFFGHQVPILVFDNCKYLPPPKFFHELGVIARSFKQEIMYVGLEERLQLISRFPGVPPPGRI